ncbi:hypothetical protein QIG54_09325, partial [Klebsiella pneumoniae]|nr:hypothetical protein [Klebsiella pneumoniae]MDH8326106.1 hypothetical protein [Klebsiella pneumoniae]
DDKGWDARKRAYCLKIQPATGSFARNLIYSTKPVKPEKQIISYGGKSLPLENGMKAESTLFLEKRRIYQWMLSPFYDMKHSATGPIDE